MYEGEGGGVLGAAAEGLECGEEDGHGGKRSEGRKEGLIDD
jgi:hypothetical protein